MTSILFIFRRFAWISFLYTRYTTDICFNRLLKINYFVLQGSFIAAKVFFFGSNYEESR